MAKKPTSRNTKSEILASYQELLQEKKDLENKIAQTAEPKQAQPLVKPTPVIEHPSAQNSVHRVTEPMKKVLQDLEQIQATFGGALNELSDQLLKEASELEEVEEQVRLEQEQLQQLHDLEVAETTLDELIEQYQTQAKTFELEWEEQRETLEQSLAEAQQAWDKARQTHQRDIEERDRASQTHQDRDGQTYDYNLQLQRKLNTETYQQTREQLEQELLELRETQEQTWQEREKAIAEREKAYTEAKAKVEAFPEELQENTKRGKDNGRNIGHYQVKIKADLRTQEMESQKKIYELRLQGLSETIQNQENRIQNLSQQLDSALKQVQDLAVKAIEGASNLKSSEALKEIALEQAKQMKGK
ncbi:hypothetical protein PN466_15490 [Roseofilum reptotaenium CS-1145]|uniref:Uncharacterized protein n=1 Tax=Roseofilum reptotaenium AO1-A TaxID=1925591 RepID=A0A1L9QU09_9CYAN|nr:hypothetical protein [Roseofilum reptotaenium]MDB9518348.1 hypothetical protein [Roseofilum reptotaenium CS-1145]OJJ26153.1 hypothetical protein BI308_08210 [Roseofilum reptotaenium AO1-A]